MMKKAHQRFAHSQVITIDQDLPDAHFKLTIVGRPSLPSCRGWGTTIFKLRDKSEFENKAGKALNRMARKLAVDHFLLFNNSCHALSLYGFPEAPISQVQMRLVEDKWVGELVTL